MLIGFGLSIISIDKIISVNVLEVNYHFIKNKLIWLVGVTVVQAFIWPVFWFVLIIIFKDNIKELLDSFVQFSKKASNLKYKDFSVNIKDEPHSLGAPLIPQYDSNNILRLEKAYQSFVITTEENDIRNQLIDAKVSSDQAIDILINNLANKNLHIKMLVIHSMIYKEQIEILQYLNSNQNFVPENKLYEFYDKWHSKNSEINYSFNDFLNFLLNNRLVAQGIKGYGISHLGNEYLKFLVTIGSNS